MFRQWKHLRRIFFIFYALMLLYPGVVHAENSAISDSEKRKSAHIATPGDSMFIDITASEYQIYLGQTLRVDYDVYLENGHGNVYYNVLEPEFANWYTLEASPTKASVVSVANKTYQKEPFATFYVTPATTGTLQLPNLYAEVPFAKSKYWITHTPRFVEVIPPPQPIPKHFAYANVGNFEIQASISSTQARVGQTLVLYFTLTSNTTVHGIEPAPYALGNIDNAFKTYNLQKDRISEIADTHGVKTSIQYHMQIVPLQPGQYTLPPLKLVSFDPKRHQYVTVASPSIDVRIEPSNLTTGISKNDIQLKPFNDAGIRPIHLKRSNLYPDFIWIFLFIPPIFLLGVIAGIELYQNKKKRAAREQKRLQFKQFEETLLQSDDARIQLRTMRDMAKLVFHNTIYVREKDFHPQLKFLLTPAEQEPAFRVLHKTMLNAASTHAPISPEDAKIVIDILKNHYDD